jgi:2-keto-4-pentenoate hydratase/2-oxohepta-3-ene-1,7-dioic acid hydratase in catechol pathway
MVFSENDVRTTAYRHLGTDGLHLQLAPGKVVCIGKNYAAHALEMNSAPPEEPILFMKPTTAIVPMHRPLSIDTGLGEHHYEAEMTVVIGERLSHATIEQAETAIAGVGVGLDLTLRALQGYLKERRWPWEKCKAFDGSCVLSAFVPAAEIPDLQNIQIRFTLNGEIRQNSNTALMLFPVLELLAHISGFFTLMPGDVVMTGTPEGVGPLAPGDRLDAELVGLVRESTTIVDRRA